MDKGTTLVYINRKPDVFKCECGRWKIANADCCVECLRDRTKGLPPGERAKIYQSVYGTVQNTFTYNPKPYNLKPNEKKHKEYLEEIG